MRPRRRTTVMLAALAAGLSLFLAACGGGNGGAGTAGGGTTTGPGSTAAAPATTTGTTTAPAPVPVAVAANVYFIRDERVAPVSRDVTPPAVARGAMTALLAGPSGSETAAGMTTSIPAGTRLLGLTITSAGVAEVDLSGEFASGGGSLSMLTRVAQVVHTLTWFPTVRSVRFLIDGRRVDAIGGEGVIVDHPLTRADVEGQAPAILIERPTEGSTVSGPVRVRGTANTFEAVLFLRLVDASGAVLSTRRVVASSGTGTRGTFSAVLPGVATAQDATLVGFERSARDGRPVNRVAVGLHLTP